MERLGLLDTGPLVSFLAAGLEHHAWTVEQWKEFRPPLLTCEPVLTEASFEARGPGCRCSVYPAAETRHSGSGLC